MINLSPLFVAFSLGVLGGAHCIGMCGGIIGALTGAISAEEYSRRFRIIISYNLGRLFSYCLIAAIFYLLVANMQDYFSFQFMRYVSGLLLVAMGLYLASWWRGLRYLEKVGGYVWRYIQPISRRLLPVNTTSQAFALGLVWGWLPCGLIYSVLVYASTADNTVNAVSIMLAFGIGTLPAVLASGLLAEKLTALIRKSAIKQCFGLLIIAFGIWTLWHAMSH